MQTATIGGIHHVTAIAGNAQRNLDFYAGFLGLRLVKKTVNFDDPTSYHLYYGDEAGRPGTILTFFPWDGAQRGQRGVGQVATVSLAVPKDALGHWLGKLSARNLKVEKGEHFGDAVVMFEDPDGLSLELVAHAGVDALPSWAEGPVAAEYAVRGVYSVTLWEDGGDKTAALLTERLGYCKLGKEGNTERFSHESGGPGAFIEVRHADGFWPGVKGTGTVHHVAFRAADEATQLELRDSLSQDGLRPTPVIDRQYFRSVYFREPGGVLFEIATDPPGFTVDEPLETLGEALKLPPKFEAIRGSLERALPLLHHPNDVAPDFSMTTPNLSQSDEPDLDFMHRWLPKSGASTTLLTLHGTVGDENSLVTLGQTLQPNASILSPRGQVLENGLPRFFRRLSEGVFDEADLKHRAGELSRFVERAGEVYGELGRVVAVGYSNGANIASATLLLHPGVLAGAVLFRPTVPFELDELSDLSGVPVFISAGRRDPLVPVEKVGRLNSMLKKAGAAVTLHWEDTGHGLVDAELRAAKRWLSAARWL